MEYPKIHRTVRICMLTAVFCISLLLSVSAAVRTGQGDGGGALNTQQPAQGTGGAPAAQQTQGPAGPGSGYYEFDGKKYVIESDWGTHYLTGFCPNEDGSRKTRSGNQARAGYTVSSTSANLGKVILIRAESAMPECTDIHRYDGLYRCEDTGGAAVETGVPNTGNVPVVDIFFDTAEEAAHVSAAGWITARIYILKEVQ